MAIAHGLNETEVTHIITSNDLLQSRLKVPAGGIYLITTKGSLNEIIVH